MKTWLFVIGMSLWSSSAFGAFEMPCNLIMHKDYPMHERHISSRVNEINTLESSEKNAVVWLGIELLNFGARCKYDRMMTEIVLSALLQGTTKEDWELVGSTWMNSVLNSSFNPSWVSPTKILSLSGDLNQFIHVFLDTLEEKVPFQKGARWTGNVFDLIRNLTYIRNKYREEGLR